MLSCPRAACISGPSAAENPHGLTAKEQAVARLVAEGLSNREVAAELYLSTKAIEYHKQKQSMATISTALGKLTERKKILLVHQGSGRDPNVYQYAHKPQEVMEIEIT